MNLKILFLIIITCINFPLVLPYNPLAWLFHRYDSSVYTGRVQFSFHKSDAENTTGVLSPSYLGFFNNFPNSFIPKVRIFFLHRYLTDEYKTGKINKKANKTFFSLNKKYKKKIGGLMAEFRSGVDGSIDALNQIYDCIWK